MSENVSEEIVPDDTDALLSRLQEAQDCFAFGNTRASVAVLGSISEKILKRHSNPPEKLAKKFDEGSSKKSLSKRIEEAVGLPKGCDKIALHLLREAANHLLPGTDTIRSQNSVSRYKTNLSKPEWISPIPDSAESFIDGDIFVLMAVKLKIIIYFNMLKIAIAKTPNTTGAPHSD